MGIALHCFALFKNRELKIMGLCPMSPQALKGLMCNLRGLQKEPSYLINRDAHTKSNDKQICKGKKRPLP